jgi:hypothetical protein
MDRFIFFICLIISIIQLLILFYFYNKFWKRNASALLFLKVFFLINVYKITFNYLLVDILRIISGGSENREYGVSSFEILEVYGIEFVSNLVYFTFFTFFLIKLPRIKSNKLLINKQAIILIVFSILSILNQIFANFFSKYLWLFKDSLYFIGPICSIILVILGIKYKRKIWIILGTTPLILTILLNLIAGLRGSIVGISICFLIISYIELNKSQFKKILIIGVLPFIFLSLVQEKLSDIKYAFVVGVTNETIDVNSARSYLNFVTDFFSDNLKIEKNTAEQKSIFKEIEFRYGAPSMFAVGFLRIASRNEFVYFKPILNSFYSFMPRQLVDNKKPVSGSVDGTEKTMGMYICYKEITGSDVSMTDFLVGCHYYWEFGWFGVIILSIIPAFYNIILIFISKKWDYFGLSLIIISFKPFWLLSKLWISEIIIMIPTIILPSILLYNIIKNIFNIKINLNYNKI